MTKQFYITTAIDYVNGEPHLGHAYEKVITDVIARAHHAMGEPTFYLTGLDEHGQKVQQAAEAKGMDPQAYCDQLATSWTKFAGTLNLTNQDFVRTTEPRHQAVVSRILSKLWDEGQFYKAEYRGWYSARQETFLTEKDRNEDGSFDEKWGEVKELVEENYYFKLKEHQQWLIDYIEANPEFVAPEFRKNEVLGFLKNNDLEDLCISRPKERLAWGIPLPFDPDYVTYVWFDALVNYVTVPAAQGDSTVLNALGLDADSVVPEGTEAKSLWPADVHVIGKDILKFHAVYWPIMLKAMGLPLPKQVLVHGWWMKDGDKIAKSTGNIVDPVAVINEWGIDAFRSYVVRELEVGPDGNWTDEGFATRYHTELANGVGNLLNRTLKMLGKYREGKVPALTNELAADADQASNQVQALLAQSRLQGSLRRLWEYVTLLNQYVDRTEPFKLAKDPEKAVRLDEVLANLCEGCRILAVLLWPFLPDTAEKIYAQLGLEGAPDKFALAKWGGLEAGHQTGEVAALFPRKDR